IGFAGNIGKAQNLEKTIEATKLCGIDSLKWLIVGDGPDLDLLKTLVEEHNLEDQYRFTGWVNGGQVYTYLSLADALFLPLMDQEVLNLTVPAKLQTYMNAAKPILAFMNGAGADMVTEADCGVTATAEDTASLATALQRTSEFTPEQLKTMGENGKRYCTEQFNKDKLINDLVQYISRAIREYGA
ncbi:MAG: glycosyltransferase, partial [Oscillospiraceae bacterium]|nr:glycosyltransferase [Oscillospiraceae bacterium]